MIARNRNALTLSAALCAALSFPVLVRAVELDHEAPSVFVVAPEPVPQELSLELRARVLDPSGVAEVTAFVRGEGEKEFTKLAMRLGENGDYVASVPPTPLRGTRISYYIEATDKSGNGPRRSGSPRRPYLARTVSELPLVSPEPVAPGSRRDGLWLLVLVPIALAAVPIVSRARRRRLEQGFWENVLRPLLRMPPAERPRALEQLSRRIHNHPQRGPIHLDPAEVVQWMQRVEVDTPLGARTNRRADAGATRDASGNRKARRAEDKLEPPAAGTSARQSEHTTAERDSIAATLRRLEEDLFWIQLLEPISRMPDEQVDEAIRALATAPLVHPREGKRLYHRNVLHSHLDRVRNSDPNEMQHRMVELANELAEWGPERPDGSSAGMTLVESLVVMAILGISVAIGAVYLRPMEAPLARAVDQTEALLRSARARSVATTSAYRVRPETNGSLTGEYASSCAATTWTAEPALDLELPDLVTLTDTSWSVCFNSRGIASSGLMVTVDHPDYNPRRVEVMLGGAIRRLPS